MSMSPERKANRKRYDAKRQQHPHRKLYKTRAWTIGRLLHLGDHPLCADCLKEGRTTAATIVDHIIPHRGDRHLFMDRSNWQSLCKTHHDGRKQREEVQGYVDALDGDGWPVDARHPANAGSVTVANEPLTTPGGGLKSLELSRPGPAVWPKHAISQNSEQGGRRYSPPIDVA